MEDVNRLTYAVNGMAMGVHRELGPGWDEIVYHQRLSDRLHLAGIAHQFKPIGRLVHRGIEADVFEPDIIVPGVLCPELKARRGGFTKENFRQVICYLKYWKIQLGLLLNFGAQSLGLRRVIYEERPTAPLHWRRMDWGD